ncbi:hypothetical protein MNBD_PLANCTO02-656 [hydrothermal vent metagenome]|uniref:CBS domain-containing protein n=1 Tax=hydrothermal vent metagenome TaxID=652676 RepID=A0A3B1DA35_9ZZZZ
MLCPDCGFDNIEGIDACDACGQPMTSLDISPSELEESISRHSISVLNPRQPESVEATTTLREAIKQLVAGEAGSLLVLDKGSLIGIVTDRDILTKVSAHLELLDQPVTTVMTTQPAVVSRSDSIAYCLRTMDLGGYRHLPVVDEQMVPTGIITVRDILRFLCVRFAEIRSALQ